MSAEFPQPTLFIVDDSPEGRVCEGTARSLGFLWSAYRSAEDFLSRFAPNVHGCALIGFRLPGIDGLQLLHRLAELDEALPVILFGLQVDVRVAVRAIQSGAHSVFRDISAADDFAETIQAAIAKNRGLLRDAWDVAARRDRFSELDARELEVMGLVLEGVPNKSIAIRLDLSPRTLNRVRSQIQRKTQTRTVVELARLAALIRETDPSTAPPATLRELRPAG